MTDDRQRPEGRLIAKALDASHMSRRALAEAVSMSEARVRQIINGYASVGVGQTVAVTAPSTTLARMAAAVGVTAEELVAAGRDDAADELREMAATERRGVVLDADRYGNALAALDEWLSNSPDEEIHPPTEVLWLWTPRQIAENLAEQVAALEASDTQMTKQYYRLHREKGNDSGRADAGPATTQAGGSPADFATGGFGALGDPNPDAESEPAPAGRRRPPRPRP